MPLELDIGIGTHRGRRRETNQDTVGMFQARSLFGASQRLPFVMVADGMGGHRGGAVASHLAIQAAGKAYQRAMRTASTEDVLLSVVASANQTVRDKAGHTPSLADMGTTFVGAMFEGQSVYIANVGDSRGYAIHDGEIEQITDDHSLVAEQVRMGTMSHEQAAVAVGRNVITRALGRREELEIDIFSVDWYPGDVILLCSDGLWGQVSDAQMLAVISQVDPQKAVEQLIQMAVRTRAPDNVGVVIVRRVS